MMALAMVLWLSVGHSLAARSRYVGEGMAAAAAGLALGAALLAARALRVLPPAAADRLMTFHTATFFVFLLPPIILHAGLAVRQRPFFDNLATITAMGVGGTYASFAVVAAGLACAAGLVGGLGGGRGGGEVGGGGDGGAGPRLLTLADCLALGAIFAATDSVAVLQVGGGGRVVGCRGERGAGATETCLRGGGGALASDPPAFLFPPLPLAPPPLAQVLEPERAPMLFNLVFGEGVINDATTIALLHTFKVRGRGGGRGGREPSFFFARPLALTPHLPKNRSLLFRPSARPPALTPPPSAACWPPLPPCSPPPPPWASPSAWPAPGS